MKHVLGVLFSVLLFFSAQAQIQEPVKWKYSTERVSETEYLLIVDAKIESKWHLYSVYSPENGPLPLFFEFKKDEKYELVGKVLESPKPHEVYEEVYKLTVKQFEHKARFIQKIKVKEISDFKLSGLLDGQACMSDGMCVPVTADFEMNISSKQAINAQAEADYKKIEKASLQKAGKHEDKVEKKEDVKTESTKESGNTTDKMSLWTFFAMAFLGGLAAILTPCVFPMIPMTVSFFMNSGESKTKGRIQAIFYAFSIIAIYTIIGTIVAVTLGANFANWLSTHWLPNIFFFLIFLFFAFSFFGMFELTLPSWMVSKTDAQADKGGWSGTFFMAFTLVLVSFSCTGPIVGAILVESANGQVLRPIVGMLGFSLAFALPFGIFAFFPSLLNNMPKSGGWLNSVKVVLGFIELALGLKFLSIADQTYHWHLLDRDVYLAIWIVLFSLMGVYLLGKIKFAHDSDVTHISVPRLILVIITFSFVTYMIPGMFGAPLKMLSGYLPPQASHDFDLNAIVRNNIETASFSVESSGSHNELCEAPKYDDIFHLPHGIKGYFDYDQALACSKEQNKPIFVDFTGHGCVNCREMESNVWSDPEVLKKLKKDFIVVALYVDDKTELPESEWVTSKRDNKVKKTIGKKYADLQISRFNINAQPYYVILDGEGNNVTGTSHAYDKDIEKFKSFLDKGKKAFYEKH